MHLIYHLMPLINHLMHLINCLVPLINRLMQLINRLMHCFDKSFDVFNIYKTFDMFIKHLLCLIGSVYHAPCPQV